MQMENLYMDLLQKRCELERKVLLNSLTLAYSKLDQFSYLIMGEKGYMSQLAGEVVHIIKCIPVEVQIRHEKLCFEQLPVSKHNESWFLTPRTHVLVKNGVQINCDTIIPHQYKINGEWYKLIPEFIDTEEAKKLLNFLQIKLGNLKVLKI